ncbi:MAG: hypothetical protein DWQ47_07235 [Acidobacteria bacterium]|nr:MAG: hypothetical protein DWQ32_15335 [Acidobacteriota bacterium]REJ99281.1 MAG: hypothetical protein DWQ38_14640 [Acidobacteriota bacterium]REK15998.1 MAG: hypothetical protein DWQ43_03045 [Acidobacteriota bacterium]REK43679.1 MAG: hypothetical protein DWQ47_07235 [Acidobacteriota bacterium]
MNEKGRRIGLASHEEEKLRHAKVRAMFSRAMDVAATDVAEFLEKEFPDDRDLHQEVLELIEHKRESFLEEGAIPQVADAVVEEDGAEATERLRASIGSEFGHYRIEGRIGEGGMGQVYAATDTILGRRVALKRLPREYLADEERVNRFKQEARAISKLNHPNIVTIYEFSRSSEGEWFIASELVEGGTVDECRATQEIELIDKVDISLQVAAAISAAHSTGYIHRDIKPSNIMVRPDGLVKVLDFGLAKLIRGEPTVDSGIDTQPKVESVIGRPIGTVAYMSPEVVKGHRADERSDIFSFGVVLYELICGKRPFQGESNAGVMAEIMRKDPDPFDDQDIPEDLASVVFKCLQKDPDLRYQTMERVVSELDSVRLLLPGQHAPYEDLHRSGNRKPAFIAFSKSGDLSDASGPVATMTPLGGVLILAVVLVIAFAGWWVIYELYLDSESSAAVYRTETIVEWNSGPSELTSAAKADPTGKFIAFGSAQSGSNEIWVQPIGGGKSLQVTDNGFYNQYPVWSPDGQEVVYYSHRGNDYGIWRNSVSGGNERQIIGGVGRESKPRFWSKSGRIYFQGRTEMLVFDLRDGSSKTVIDFGSKGIRPMTTDVSDDETKIAVVFERAGTWIVNVGELPGSDSRDIYQTGNHISHLSWSQDSESVLISEEVNGIFQVVRVSVADGEAIQLTRGATDLEVEDVLLSGEILVSSSFKRSVVWAVDIESGKEEVLSDNVLNEYWPVSSPGSGMVALRSIGRSAGNTGHKTVVQDTATASERATVFEGGTPVKWSPDGSSLAVLKETDSDYEVWSVGQDGRQSTRLTDSGVQMGGYRIHPYLRTDSNHVSWAPNAKYLAYIAYREGVYDLWLYSFERKDEVRSFGNRVPRRSICCLHWSTDSERLYYLARTRDRSKRIPTRSEFWVFELQEFNHRKIGEVEADVRLLGFNATRSTLIYSMRQDPSGFAPVPKSTVFKSISIDDGHTSELTQFDHSYFDNSHISPDGSIIALTARRNNLESIWLIPIVGGEARALVVENDPKNFISTLEWSWDGTRIMYGKQFQMNRLSLLTKET